MSFFYSHKNIFLKVIGTHSAVANQIPNVSLSPSCAFQEAAGEESPMSTMLSRLSDVTELFPQSKHPVVFSSPGREFREGATARLPLCVLFQGWHVGAGRRGSSPCTRMPPALPRDPLGTTPTVTWCFRETTLNNIKRKRLPVGQEMAAGVTLEPLPLLP